MALTSAGATSLMHEAKVDVVTVPNLSEHLPSSDTTAQLSARFAYAAAMTSINNLLLLDDGETRNRQRVDFAGLPEMVRTFLQVAAGAADIPVTRLLGQSPAGLSATGESDTRNYYDMIAARQDRAPKPIHRHGTRAGPSPAAGAARPADAAFGGARSGRAELRVPAAVAVGRAGPGGAGAVEGAGHADLRGAGAVATGGDGAARRGATRR